MTDVKKTYALLKSELQGSRGGESVVVIMLTAVMIFANIMLVSVLEYIGSVIYFTNPNARNAVKVTALSENADFDTIKNDSDVEFCFMVTEYSERFSTLYAVSEEFFDSSLSFLSKDDINALNQVTDGVTPIFVSSSLKMQAGDTGQRSDGSQYQVAGVIPDDVKYILLTLVSYEDFAVAPDSGQFTYAVPTTNPMLYVRLKNNADISAFQERYKDIDCLITPFDPDNIIYLNFSSSVTISVIGISVFIVSFFAVIINCYLVFCGKRRYYQTLITVGGRKKLFLQNSLIIKAVQLMISAAVSALILVILNVTLKGEFITVQSGLLSAAFAALVMALSQFMLIGWLKGIKTV